MTTVEDLRYTIVPKSDQLNSEQLIAGPITITVTDVRIGSAEQPISVHYEGENGRPYRPCKTCRKALIFAWGPDGREWIGRSMTLYCDPQVKFGGDEVGGIRISHMTDIDRDIELSLTATRGKKALHTIRRLTVRGSSINDIAHSPTVEALKDNFGAAYKATKDPAVRARLKAAYDARMGVLTKAKVDQSTGEIAPSKSYATVAESILNASSAEAAALELDAARDSFDEAQLKDLSAIYRRKWEPS